MGTEVTLWAEVLRDRYREKLSQSGRNKGPCRWFVDSAASCLSLSSYLQFAFRLLSAHCLSLYLNIASQYWLRERVASHCCRPKLLFVFRSSAPL